MSNLYAIGDWILFSWEARQGDGELANTAENLHPCSYAEIIGFSEDLVEVNTIYGQRIQLSFNGIGRKLPTPIAKVGDLVSLKSGSAIGKIAVVQSVSWHHKDQDWFYHVSVDGRKKSRRYFTDDLERQYKTE